MEGPYRCFRFQRCGSRSRRGLLGLLMRQRMQNPVRLHLACCVTRSRFSKYPDASDGLLDTILFKRLRVFRLGLISEPWFAQTKRFETSSKSRRNGATAGNTRVYTDNPLKQALIAWWARLGVNAVGFIAKHCSSVMPA